MGNLPARAAPEVGAGAAGKEAGPCCEVMPAASRACLRGICTSHVLGTTGCTKPFSAMKWHLLAESDIAWPRTEQVVLLASSRGTWTAGAT